jgi:predicted protein tyrosine phosphatase
MTPRIMREAQDSVMLPAMSEDLIYVGPLSAVEMTVRQSRCSHLVTLINDQTMVETPPTIGPGCHLRLAMNDIAEPQPGMTAPADAHVTELIAFASRWAGKGPMMIHCWAGISRSTAAAFITQCVLNPQADERALAEALRAASRTATPNRRLVALADAALGREGRMTSAIEAIGHGEMTLEATLFCLPARITG